jgi:hypothetical protein
VTVSLDLVDYDGPLGAFAGALSRRRIAVASDPRGRVALVRPDSVVLEFGDNFDEVETKVRRLSLEVLGGELPPEPPPSGTIAIRPGRAQRVTTRPSRWQTKRLREWVDDMALDRVVARPNQVYLADGVARHFGLLDDTGSGTPGLTRPTSIASTVQPAVPPRHLPRPLRLPGRRPPSVLVLDTGLRTIDAHSRAEHPWLRDHCVIHQPWRDLRTVGRWDDEDEPDDDGRGRLDEQAGHGTFITGIIRQLCPDAIVHHRGVLTSYGDGDDASIISAIERAMPRVHGYDIVVMAFGTYGAADAKPPMAEAIERLLCDSLVVASAGNDATSRPYYPAALPGVVAVGALDQAGRARFSNFGSWVDACTPAVDVVSTFFTDVDDRCACCGSVTQQYRGWARWSGTSFAAPKVAGVVAQEMYLHDCSARDAWARLAGPARHRHPDLGVVFNV